LDGAKFVRSDLSGSALEDVGAKEALFEGVRFRGCSLVEGDFSSARFDACDLNGSDLSDSLFLGAIFKRSVFLHGQARDAKWDGAEFTECSDFERPEPQKPEPKSKKKSKARPKSKGR
jgi:uncharacterized protein YjbI with pentapeptide repeats